MANLLGQVTIPASGKISLASGIQQPGITVGSSVGGPQIGNLYVQQLQIQNNGANNMRIGDATVSSTRGIIIASTGAPGGSDNLGGFINYGSYLSDWWIQGTPGDVCDFLYIQ